MCGRSKQVILPYSSSIWLFMYVNDKSGALRGVHWHNMSVVTKKVVCAVTMKTVVNSSK